MSLSTLELPGLERVRARFVEILSERQTAIANFTVCAWEAQSVSETRENLAGAQSILHQIAGSAGSLGFGELGEDARNCEVAIINHLAGAGANQIEVPSDLMLSLDDFVGACRDVFEAAA